MAKIKQKLLLHICCAPCSTYVVEKLLTKYDVSGYFYNPNLYPVDEHNKRLKEAQNYFGKIDKDFICEQSYQKKEWMEYIKGLEKESEGGKRCLRCYLLRLEKTAQCAKKRGFGIFTTTLTISPYKKAAVINPIGKAMAQKYRLEYLSEDFKKADGYKKSIEMSKQHQLYRQNYCGCEFSLKK